MARTAKDGLPRQAYRRVIAASLCFVLGFTTVFVTLGASASMIGRLLKAYQEQLAMAAGVIIILFGLHFLGLLKIPLLYRDTRFHAKSAPAGLAGAYVIGLAFAFGWTPCVGPILATVLAVAANEGSLGMGVRLLFFYSLGLGVPFILAAVAIGPFMRFLQRFKRHMGAVERVMGGSHRRALVLVRPPGHHAERSRAMGFCLYNNVAVAAAHARALGAGRVAIVDYDVHHGNGTQRIFQDDPSVLYVSTHQYPAYPGTGASGEVGDGSGAGFTVNLPVEAGAVDEDYRLVFREIVAPVIGQFKPDLLLVSAGFDAHEQDPLAGMRLTTPAFPGMTAELARLADESCDGRMAVVTEGGYNLGAFAESLRGVMNVLGAGRTPAPEWPAPTPVTSIRGRRTADEAKRVLSPYWRF